MKGPCHLALLALIGCTSDGKPPRAAAIAVSRNARGAPRLVHAHDLPPAPAATASESARIHLERLAPSWGVSRMPTLAALGEVAVGGGTIARLDQVLDGLPVWGGELHVLVRPGGILHAISGTLLDAGTPRAPARFIDNRDHAVARAIGTRRLERALAKQVWYPLGGRLVAAWVVDAYVGSTTSSEAFRTILAGVDGHVLARYSLEADAFTYRVYAETTGDLRLLDGPIVDATPHPTGVPDRSYPAYLPSANLVTVEGLNHPVTGTPDPWLVVDATETVGNNADAYVDLNAPSGLSAGDFRAPLSAPATFSYVYELAAGPLDSTTQQMAAITSLFYSINWLHDFWYDAGLVESTGNAQTSNFGRGGREDDAMLAEAQDNALGGSRNNANMSTPMDGLAPRMQVYLWSGKDDRSLAMTPSGRSPDVGAAVFGPKNFDVAGAMMVGDDGTGANPTDGCTALPACTGKVVVVDRGNCTFKTKAASIQSCGGIGMIVVNNTSSATPPPMGDDATISTPITIGMLSVTSAEGAQIKQDIATGLVDATMHRRMAVELEGSLDSTVIAHEFGHFVHHRLSSCENTMCRAMSEGWADFDALLQILRAGDNLEGAFPLAIYSAQSFNQDPAYYGIRRAPYSVDTNINALSFRHMADGEPLPTTHPILTLNNNAEIHNAGEIWAEVLWEGYVALQKAGTSFEEVRSKMARYVVAGLLLAPSEATPTETRDAILEAVLAASPADHDLLMSAFARRGFGSCAVSPPRDSIDFKGIVESSIVAGEPQLDGVIMNDACDHDGVLDAGETAKLRLEVANQGHAPISDVTLAVTSTVPGLTVMSPPVTLAKMDAFETLELDVDVRLDAGATEPIAGDLSLTVSSTGSCDPMMTVPIATRMNVDEQPASSATDTFDTADSSWEPWTAAWAHVRESALDGAWHGDDITEPGDTRLTSPSLHASAAAPLVITFTHRYSFEYNMDTSWDGGVVEYTLDDGVTWEDVAALTSPGYNAMVTAQTGNVLGDRMAYTRTNPSYPGTDTETLDFGTALADKELRIRFRIGTDAGNGAPGWDIDDVAFSGIVGTPFASQVADDGVCDGDTPRPDDPVISGGGGCCDAGPPGDSAFVAFGVLGLVLRRRRR